jgi:large subunit ribosomal protein L2
MGIKTFSPRSAGLRGKTGFDFSEITKDFPEKSLTSPIRRTAARNNTGQITMRHVGISAATA